MTSISPPTTSFTHVKWDMRSFNDLLIQKLKTEKPTRTITEEDWQRAASAASKVYKDFLNAVLIDSSLEFLLNSVLSCMEEEFSRDPNCKEVIRRVEKIYQDIYEEIRLCDWSCIPVPKFLSLYRQFLKTGGTRYADHISKMWFPQNKPTPYEIEDVDVELPMSIISNRFHEYGVIQLREINPDADTLIIGCGNGRISNDGNTPIEIESRHDARYSLKHNHPKSHVTIDPDLSANPTVAAFFGSTPIAPLFQGKKFDWIIFEGTPPDPSLPYYASDLKALLSPTGQVLEI